MPLPLGVSAIIVTCGCGSRGNRCTIIILNNGSDAVEEVFAFFSDANNLEAITPRQLNFHILTPGHIRLAAGARIDYQLTLYGIPLKWATLIERWEPPHEFVDVQLRGPYRVWRHTHRFLPEGPGTRIVDDVDYELPFGPVGRLVDALWTRREVAQIFGYRTEVIARQFS